jgi:hypothetical protein
VAKVTLCGFRRAVPYKKKTSRNSAQETQGIKGMSRHSAAHYFLEDLVDLGVEYAERGIDPTGAVVLTVRYGAKPIEFAPGKAAIAVGRKEKLISTLETVIAAVEAGELDGCVYRKPKPAHNGDEVRQGSRVNL